MKIRMIKKLTRIAIVSLFALFTKSGYGQSLALTVTKQISCFNNSDGELKVEVTGITPDTFKLYDSATNSLLTAKSTSSLIYSFIGLYKNTYKIVVTASSSTDSLFSYVSLNQPTKLSIAYTKTQPSCYEKADGKLDFSTTNGGVSPYSYSRDNINFKSSDTFLGIKVGTFPFYVVDANGCSATVNINFSKAVLSLAATYAKPLCKTDLGTLNLVGSGGNMPYTYTVDTINNSWSTKSVSQTNTRSLKPGFYTVKIEDVNNCAPDTVQILCVNRDKNAPVPLPHYLTKLYLNKVTGLAPVTTNTVDSASTDSCSIASFSLSKTIFSCADVGINKITFYVKDPNNNTDSAYCYIQVLDTTKPKVAIQPVSLYLHGSANTDTLRIGSVLTFLSDNCTNSNQYTFEFSDTVFDCSKVGAQSVSLKIKDVNGNVFDTLVSVTVYDTIAPNLNVLDTTLYLDATGNATLTWSIINNGSSDNCSIDSIQISQTAFDCSHIGGNSVFVKIFDPSFNADSATINVNVLDTLPPSLSTNDYTLIIGVSGSASIKNSDILSVTDNCSLDSIYVSQRDFTVADTGDNWVYVWATDASGNKTLLDSAKVTVVVKDTDGDGIPDHLEGNSDTDKDGMDDYRDKDSDNDGILDDEENELNTTANLDFDGDGLPNYKDLDSDDDGIYDVIEVDGVDPDTNGISGIDPVSVDSDGVPVDAAYNNVDTDGDGAYDYKDTDADGDGILDKDEKGATTNPVDTDGDKTCDWRDLDTDDDGIADNIETSADFDSDGTGNWRDLDSDDDAILDSIETDVDTDADGDSDFIDLDSDNDTIADKVETDVDTDGDKTGDWRDLDSDNDGIVDSIETDIDTDLDGKFDFRDLDADNDGIQDSYEKQDILGTSVIPVDTDSDGTPDFQDTDSDDDGISDQTEDVKDTDGDGVEDFRDTDSDGDGILDKLEGTVDSDSDGKADYLDTDSDNDGISDKLEGSSDFDGDGTPNYLDLDSDNDTISDQTEGTNDVDTDGNGNWLDLDSDGDTISDQTEGTNDADGDTIGNWLDLDSDGDTISDQTEGTNDADGDTVGNWLDTDSDGDGISDQIEGTNDADGDTVGNWLDTDSDGDGISDQTEGTNDADGDSIPNYLDLDSDGDGISDQTEGVADADGDGTSNYLDLDSDDDGISDQVEGTTDTDLDGTGNWLDTDSDNDSISDKIEGVTDTDSDGTANYLDLDSDGDGISDQTEGTNDADGDGKGNWLDLDSDGDGISDQTEGTNDADGDGTGNWLDLDSDGDGISDQIEGSNDTDGDGTSNYLDLDSDGDGITDQIETNADYDGDGIGNWLDLDSDDDELLDSVEGTVDTNNNGKPDFVDAQYIIPEGFSPNGDGLNDYFVISGLKVYAESEFIVFNQYGQMVYDSNKGYNNKWDGTYAGRGLKFGTGTVPEGIYYFVFKPNKFNLPNVTGNIYIKP